MAYQAAKSLSYYSEPVTDYISVLQSCRTGVPDSSPIVGGLGLGGKGLRLRLEQAGGGLESHLYSITISVLVHLKWPK